MDGVDELQSQSTSDGDGTQDRTVPGVIGKRKDGKSYVKKNSLSEAGLLNAGKKARSDLKRKAKTDATDQDRKDDRRTANRLSAFQSRQRRKMVIEDLQKTVGEQSKHNSDQAKQIDELKREIQVARQENELLRGSLGSTAPLLGGLGQIASNPGHLMMAQPQFGMQQQLLQNTMLQNALLFSAQTQQGGNFGGFDLLKLLGAGQTSNAGQDYQNDFSANDKKKDMQGEKHEGTA